MNQVQEIAVPEATLIGAVLQRRTVYADAFAIEHEDDIDLPKFITAFYTSPVFWPERVLLGAMRPRSTDAERLAQLAAGDGDRFAVWKVVGRRDTEILLRDGSGRTASWLAVGPGRVYFGSIVYPTEDKSGKTRMGALFWLLKGFHRLYAQALLRSAFRRCSAL